MGGGYHSGDGDAVSEFDWSTVGQRDDDTVGEGDRVQLGRGSNGYGTRATWGVR